MRKLVSSLVSFHFISSQIFDCTNNRSALKFKLHKDPEDTSKGKFFLKEIFSGLIYKLKIIFITSVEQKRKTKECYEFKNRCFHLK